MGGILGSFVIGTMIMLTIMILITDSFKENWGLKRPETCKEIYYTDEGSSFQGDGIRYHVYTCSLSDEVLQWIHWKSGLNEAVELSVRDWLSQIEVEDSYNVPFDRDYMYLKLTEDRENRAYFIWSEEMNQLYIVESFL